MIVLEKKNNPKINGGWALYAPPLAVVHICSYMFIECLDPLYQQLCPPSNRRRTYPVPSNEIYGAPKRKCKNNYFCTILRDMYMINTKIHYISNIVFHPIGEGHAWPPPMIYGSPQRKCKNNYFCTNLRDKLTINT